jgi:hypothetical protein
MGSLNSNLLNNEKNPIVVKNDIQPYEKYNDLDKYKYIVKEYWKKTIESFQK